MRYIRNILKAENLSDITKKDYETRLKLFIERTNEKIENIIKNPEKYIQWINENANSLQTKKSYIASVMAIFKYNPNLKKQQKKSYEKWYSELTKINNDIDEIYKKNEPTEKQKNSFIEFSEIIKKRDLLEKGSIERLILAMYSYIEPVRNDYNEVYIYETEPEKIEYNNYIILDQMKMVIKDHKNGKKMIYEKKLGEELINEIKESLIKKPRQWLFEDRTGNPYKPNSINKYINRVLEKLFGKPLTINGLRHSYITAIDFNKTSIKDREKIALEMGHSTALQERYKFIQ
jgi:integrase